LRNDVRSILRRRVFSSEGCIKAFVFASLFQKWKHIEGTLAHNVSAAQSGDVFHGVIPGCVTTLAIEREYALDSSVEELREKEILW
jgi:hypothetical protein